MNNGILAAAICLYHIVVVKYYESKVEAPEETMLMRTEDGKGFWPPFYMPCVCFNLVHKKMDVFRVNKSSSGFMIMGKVHVESHNS